MNRDWEENRIRNLFHELRQEDERQIPSFDGILKSPAKRNAPLRRPRLVLRAAVVVVTLALIAAFAFALLRPISSPEQTVPRVQVKTPVEKEEPPDEIAPAPIRESVKAVSRNPRRKRLPDENIQAAKLISEWRSPTDFLLKTPGQELFDTAPRPDKSVVEIKGIFPYEKN